MPSDNRLSRMLHVLIHMDQHEGALTSAAVARMLQTNPVVVRRTMAGLREAGYVQSEKGHGGGWTLARGLEQITLLDVYRSLGEPPVFSLGLAGDSPECLIEQAVNDALEAELREARQRLMARFGAITLAGLARDFATRRCRPGGAPEPSL
ncbi:Rrf2 family transcriptional regulator [Janthinobacterium fluminis]|uniref:Rrf2 family transcriptional regulator n=1 Tax=Janthinobacterium fluminis TaxID=2987524 RepID=A0ABT5K3K2_9BURK|nr:Rrf2 family transcriptional regulator [Janthinobacterium fluminis]MDC8759270.1 Rrf2 family transcriptional regulator [Janthinobacterium fluminis]